MDQSIPSTVEVYSDLICPWCWIGKRRLDKALGLLGDRRDQVSVVWRPFQLNPDVPAGGIERRAYRTAKFGSWERSLELDARVAAVGAAEGLAFAFDRMARTPNTFDAHRLLWLAGERGVQAGAAEGLFGAYFAEGRDIGDRAVLVEIGAAAGMDAADLRRTLNSGAGTNEVRAEEGRARALGIDGVPAFLLDGRELLVGAREPERLAASIRRLLAG